MENIIRLFGDKRVVGLAGDKSTGKTNNLMALLREFRESNKNTPIYVYGLNENTLNWVKKLGGVFEVSSIEQLTDKKDSLIVVDEYQRLHLNDRRYKELLDAFIDFIYHNNNWVIFSCPNLREFNSVIGGKIERWALKSLRLSEVVNGSQLKNAVMCYNGRYKVINDIQIDKDKILVINDNYEQILQVSYIPEIDDKRNLVNIFNVGKNCQKNVKGIVK